MILKIGFYSREINSLNWIYIDNIKKLQVNRTIIKDDDDYSGYEDFRAKCQELAENFVYSDFLIKITYNDNSNTIILVSNLEKTFIVNDEGKTIDKI